MHVQSYYISTFYSLRMILVLYTRITPTIASLCFLPRSERHRGKHKVEGKVDVDHDVLWFEVPVENAFAMNVSCNVRGEGESENKKKKKKC